MPPVITDKYYLGMFNEKSRWGMTSGNKTPVSDNGADGHSIFAYQLLKELGNNKKPYISTREIYTSIAPIIGNNSEQVPLCNPILYTGDQGGQFIFLLASSGAVVDSPAPVATKTKTLLSVKANVAAAKVYVDGSYIGNTNLADKEVPPGRHQIRVEKEGYQPYTRELTFRQGREKSLQAILDLKAPATGSLYIRTEPTDAAIRILNIGPKFSQGMELSPGRYHVEVSASGYTPQRRWVELSSGEDKDFDIRLEPLSSASPRKDYVSPAQPTPPATSSGAVMGNPFTNSHGMEFVYIKPGSFMMGSPTSEKGRDDDESQHEVTLTKGYYLQTTEVTQGQWQAVMGNNPSHFNNCGENCPVENVSWDDIQEFIKKLNQQESNYQYRLPKEAEWEYAARAGSRTAFANGDITEMLCARDSNLDAMGWYCYNAKKSTHPVATKKPNAWGLYDMHGNVWEWCQDRNNDYPSGSVTDPQGSSSGSSRVLRGGGGDGNSRDCRSANRGGSRPGGRHFSGGFRLAASLFSR